MWHDSAFTGEKRGPDGGVRQGWGKTLFLQCRLQGSRPEGVGRTCGVMSWLSCLRGDSTLGREEREMLLIEPLPH